ncbi:MAG: TIGR00730 family Rossman fold protein, partial [Anaerolineales bacterium]|nr:TIGR00730 family Rossman fold protein [Anaerolineales bacterium]
LASHHIGLVYGGGDVGVMGDIANAVLQEGGEVIGIIPKALATKEVAHFGVTEIEIVDSMHTRKARMAELSDAFIALPGGIGTMEELFETWTWAQLGYHQKPVGLLNTAGYYTPLLDFLDKMVLQGFLKEKQRHMLLVDTNPVHLLEKISAYRAPAVPQWLAKEEL